MEEGKSRRRLWRNSTRDPISQTTGLRGDGNICQEEVLYSSLLSCFALLVRHGRRRGGRDGRLGEGYPRLVGREAGDADVVVAFCANITI